MRPLRLIALADAPALGSAGMLTPSVHAAACAAVLCSPSAPGGPVDVDHTQDACARARPGRPHARSLACACEHAHMHARMHPTHTHTQTYTHAHAHAYACANAHTHTHTHPPTPTAQVNADAMAYPVSTCYSAAPCGFNAPCGAPCTAPVHARCSVASLPPHLFLPPPPAPRVPREARVRSSLMPWVNPHCYSRSRPLVPRRPWARTQPAPQMARRVLPIPGPRRVGVPSSLSLVCCCMQASCVAPADPACTVAP